MKRISGRLWLSFAVIPALLVTGASLATLVSSNAMAPAVNDLRSSGNSINAPARSVPAAQMTLTHEPAERAGLETLLAQPAASAAWRSQMLRSERLPRPQVQPAPAVSRHTAIAPPVAPQPAIAQPHSPSSNNSGSNSGSGGGGQDGEDDDGHRGGDDDNDGEGGGGHHGGDDGEDGEGEG